MRNHIKVEQQLKLHIEVIQEKVDDLEKEKETTQKSYESEKIDLNKKIKQLEDNLKQKKKEQDQINN